jgi:hypothetical protein
MSTGWNTFPAQIYPGYGAVVAHELGYNGAMPPYVQLPEAPREYTPGAGYLSAQFHPFIIAAMNDPDIRVRDMDTNIPRPRLDQRAGLRPSLDKLSETLSRANDEARSNAKFYEKAYDLLTSPKTKAAFDLTKEPERIRDLYGRPEMETEIKPQGANDVVPNRYNRSIVGQGLLMARRLVESGVRFVTVVGRGWDTHTDNFNRLKGELLPYVDRAVAALLQDLHQRGMLETTLVMVTGDFNRTPRINKDAGRDHWPYVQTVFLAGGGIQGGQVNGTSDANGEFPDERPIQPEQISAAIYHKFGIDIHKELHSPQGRPFKVLPDGAKPLADLL